METIKAYQLGKKVNNYYFVLNEPLTIGLPNHQTTVVQDCDRAEKYLTKLGKYTLEDEILVHSGTCSLIFLLIQSLTAKEIFELTEVLNKEERKEGGTNFYRKKKDLLK